MLLRLAFHQTVLRVLVVVLAVAVIRTMLLRQSLFHINPIKRIEKDEKDIIFLSGHYNGVRNDLLWQ
jgi:hypothetical protein